jgi:hypothetical protein
MTNADEVQTGLCRDQVAINPGISSPKRFLPSRALRPKACSRATWRHTHCRSGIGPYKDPFALSVTRPDAHLKPQADCLHYCVPSVPNEWVNFLWHSMVMAAQNDDYDDDSAAAYSVRGR